jgi:hypothetical protein
MLTPLLACCLGAQTAPSSDPDEPDNSTDSSTSVTSTTPLAFAYAPLDSGQKYLYSFNEMAGPAHWIGFAAHAAIDQARNAPGAWGGGPDSFGVRLANVVGRDLLRTTITFGVSEFDHEDPRYFPLATGTKWTRTKYAFVHTFVARQDGGGWMPAYSRLLADYSTPFIAQTWQPQKFGIGRGFRGGSVAVGLGFGSNVWHEFWPDIKKKIWKGSARSHASGQWWMPSWW